MTIYGIRDQSHDLTIKIFELSLKNGVRLIYNIAKFASFPVWKYFAMVQNEWINESLNEKSLSSEMIDKEQVLLL
jgi:hypothetical protein